MKEGCGAALSTENMLKCMEWVLNSGVADRAGASSKHSELLTIKMSHALESQELVLCTKGATIDQQDGNTKPKSSSMGNEQMSVQYQSPRNTN